MTCLGTMCATLRSQLGASAVSGHWSIYLHVTDFGAVVLAATMNVRGVLHVLLHLAV